MIRCIGITTTFVAYEGVRCLFRGNRGIIWLRVYPLLNFQVFVVVSPPQSHLQSHLACPVLLFAALATTTSRSNLTPIRSTKFEGGLKLDIIPERPQFLSPESKRNLFHLF